MNLATRKGRISSYATAFFILGVMGGVIVLFLRMDFTTFQMRLEEETITIEAPLYSYKFDKKEVEQVTLTEVLPEHAIKTNGAATKTYYLGNFRIQGYGNAKLYIYRDNPPYILISLKDKTIYFNTMSVNETMMYYDQLLDALEEEK